MSSTSAGSAKRFVPVLFLAAALCALAQTQPDAANTPAPPPDAPASLPSELSSSTPARLADVEGSVRIQQLPAAGNAPEATQPGMTPAPPPDMIFKQAVLNMPIMAGMQVETGDDGRAELQFDDGSVARLTPDSAVQVVSLGGGGEELHAISGLTYYELPERSSGIVHVQVGPDRVRLEQGALLRLNLDTAPYQAAILRGSAHFSNPASDIGFEAITGETATLDPASAVAYDLKQDVASDSWDQWNADRDATLEQMASGETNARVGNGNGGDAAWNDLDYYGTWYNIPGAGMAWSPDGVDASFDPYGQGAWGYYPGSGYVWASAYPWGWLPYRCGGWSYYRQFGWMWQPGGGCGYGGSGWYPYGGIHHAPEGYRLPGHPPVRPFDPRLRSHLGGVPMPRSQPLAEVHRGPAFQFRQTGDARPEPRVFPVEKSFAETGSDGAVAPTLPLVAVPSAGQYRGGNAFNGGGAVSSQHLNGNRAIFTPGSHVIAPAPRILPGPRMSVTPPPHFSPPPAPAPRMAAPAAVPRGH